MTLVWRSQVEEHDDVKFLEGMERCEGRSRTYRDQRVDTIRLFDKAHYMLEDGDKDMLIRMMINRWDCTAGQLRSIRHWIKDSGMSQHCKYATYPSKLGYYSDKNRHKHNKCDKIHTCLCNCHGIQLHGWKWLEK